MASIQEFSYFIIYVQTLLYDNVAECETRIAKTIMSEEELFWKTYDKGKKLLEDNIISQQHVLPGLSIPHS